MRQIVKLSNGRLGVESEYGKGSMFWFELPYSLPPPKSRSRETSVPPSLTGDNGGPGWRPIMSRMPTAGVATPTTPALGMIMENSSHGDATAPHAGGDKPAAHKEGEDRPAMVTTESTLPLLSSHQRRRSSSSTS